MTDRAHDRRRPVLRWVATGACAALLVAVPMACGDDDDDAATTTVDGGSSALPPIIADLSSIDSTTVEVPVGSTVDLTGGGDAVTDWTAEIADEAVASFVPGRDDGSATFNPGLDALAAGSTEVTMTNSSSGDTVTFTVNVT